MAKSVAVLGCGPAGLLVAHAAKLSGWNFTIYSRKQKSKLYGAQYWHKPIPEIDGEPTLIKYKLRGTPEQYRKKVYGEAWDGTVSPEDYADDHDAWDIRAGYDSLWDWYSSEIWEMDLHKGLFEVSTPWVDADLVVSTVPRKIWAMPNDVFESQRIWALGDSDPDGGLASQDDFTVICDGTPLAHWYRSAKIFGHSTLEWPYRELWKKPPMGGATIVEKPLCHNSTSASDWYHLGRYGAWQKGVLTTDAFYDAMKILAEDRI